MKHARNGAARVAQVAAPRSAGPLRETYTFSDVLLVPQRSPIVSRKDVDTTGRFSRRISLHLPIVSANMDTVTEAEMAIAMARFGGLGIIHRFLTIEEECAEVAKVKRAEGIVIERPYTLSPTDTVAGARELMRRWEVGGLLVVDAKKKLVGIVTTRDLKFLPRGSDGESVTKVMTDKVVTVKPGASLAECERILSAAKVEKLPVVDASGQVQGLITAKDLMKKRRHPVASLDKKGRLLVGAAIGVVGDYLERTAALLESGADVLVLDVAHGHADHVIAAVERIKAKWPKTELVAGNVATWEGARDLASAGADGVKIGVGPGATCSTRIVTGSGVPQLSAVLECARITRERDIPITADGGIRDSGDIVKALAGGASCVMVGSLLAGSDESPGWTVVRKGMKYKAYRGMASLAATVTRRQKEGAAEFEAEQLSEIVPEGVEALVPYRGKAAEVLKQLDGGLRSGMSYSGAPDLRALWRNAEFVRITPAGWAESKPHAVE
ncbi:MAG: IMP dehydrogenase [Elusimicrobia bacterium]|nr:IMP dehydrogenase [Elusimicrobiota bacterium]